MAETNLWPRGALLDFAPGADARELEPFVRKLEKDGPDRVMLTAEGDATSPARAARIGIRAELVFIRTDGWTLGAPERLAAAAYALWSAQWLGVVRQADELVRNPEGELW